MAPIKPRYSVKTYAGKRQPKQSLLFPKEEDAFDFLLPSTSASRVFESSSEHPSTSLSRNDSEPLSCNTSSDQLPSTPHNSSYQSANKKDKRTKIKKEKITKAGYTKLLNKIKHTCNLASSTPKFRMTKSFESNSVSPFSRLIESKSDSFESFSMNKTSEEEVPCPPIRNNSLVAQISDSVHSLKDNSWESIARESCGSSLYQSTTHNTQSKKQSWIKSSKKFSDLKDERISLSTSENSENIFHSRDSPETSPVHETLPCCTSENVSELSGGVIEEEHASVCDTSHEEDIATKHSDNTPEETCLSEISLSESKESTSLIDDSTKGDASLSQDDESILLQDKSEFFSAEENSIGKSKGRSVEDVLSRLSLGPEVSHVSSSDRITVRKRKNWGCSRFTDIISPTDNPSYLMSEQQSLPSSGSDVDKRKIYQRLSRSLPASFKDRPPAFLFDRFYLPDIDLGRSRKTLAKLRDESLLYPSLTCSTRSLPAVLEDQDQESSNDEESQTPRSSIHFRKNSFDTSLGSSPLFLGFSSTEKSMSRRAYALKKLNSEELSCTSPHTLPALPEDESDSSCEEDESKRMESGSSSQVESPLMSPGVQGSPSRRGSSRISTSNSSETSLSSRSEGITSPLQDEMGNMLSPRASSPDVAAGSSEEDSGSSPVRRDEQRRRRPSRLTKRTLGYIAEETESDSSEPTNMPNSKRERLVLMAGKKYRRSLAIIHSLRGEENVLYEHKGRSYVQSVETVKMLQREDTFHADSDDSSDLSPDPRRSVINRTVISRNRSRRSSTAVYCVNSNPVDVSVVCSNFFCLPSRKSSLVSQIATSLDSSNQSIDLIEDEEDPCETRGREPAEAVILWISGQEEPLHLRNLYADDSLKTWKKVGEGVYSEVFSLSRQDQPPSVLKIIPIDGDIIVNGGAQKTLVENLSEVLITHYLSDLRKKSESHCDGFVELLKVWYLEGAYTEELINLWNDFDINYGSDNDRPIIFPIDQRYLGLELVNSGQALESYTFSSARQSIALFKQVVFSLATAESIYEFEHRDLHWGNILVDKTKHKSLDYRIYEENYSVATNGVRATIIDYTWSSLTYQTEDGNTRIVNDMEQDQDLFVGSGDFQFEVYRLMREDVEQDWNRYQPKTNLRWLYYLAEKLINRAKYLRPSANAHKTGIASLQKILDFIPHCDNSLQVALEVLNYK